MELLRLIKYPGSKGVLIPEIRRIFRESGKNSLIDVFGGSGIVSLNVRAGATVYNELNPQLVNLFTVIQEHPSILIDVFGRIISQNRKTDPASSHISTSYYQGRIRESLRNVKSDINIDSASTSSIRTALETLITFGTSFGGLGETYSTDREKASRAFLLKVKKNLPAIARKVTHWKIRNLDFRNLIEEYDSSNSFFYLDPPYLTKKWYGENMEIQDFEQLRNVLSSIKGIYLMNLDATETDLVELFGKPTFVKDYSNKNGGNRREENRVRCFYTNVRSGK